MKNLQYFVKAFVFSSMLSLTACPDSGGGGSAQGGSLSGPTTEEIAANPKQYCEVYDICTYNYTPYESTACVTNLVFKDVHPEIPDSYFNGKSCIFTAEDRATQITSWTCGPTKDQPCYAYLPTKGWAIPDLKL